jgi:hypothetical protein
LLRVVVPILAVAALLSTACAKSTTQPSSGSPSGSPVILGTSPSQPSLSDAPQILNVVGHDFETGLVGSLNRPDGRSLQFVAADFHQLTATAFQLSVTLDIAGDYQLQVKNASGQTSPQFTISVRPAAQGSLTLITVSPTTTLASAIPQAINVSGLNFDSTLELILTAPDSTQSFYNSAAMAGLSSNAFSLNVTMDKVGTYSIVVRNASNSISNALTIDVRRTF